MHPTDYDFDVISGPSTRPVLPPPPEAAPTPPCRPGEPAGDGEAALAPGRRPGEEAGR